jgi:hypothetical protein
MSILTGDITAKKVFGNNVYACLALTGKDIVWLAQTTNLSKKLLHGLESGTCQLDKGRIAIIAEAFGLNSLQLIKSYGPVDRRYEQLRLLLEDAGTVTLAEVIPKPVVPAPAVSVRRTTSLVSTLKTSVPVQITEAKAKPPRTIATSPPPVMTPVKVMAAMVLPPVKPSEPEPIVEDTVEEVESPPEVLEEDEEGVLWHRTGHFAKIGSITYDLTDRGFRILIARRLRFLKGPLTFAALAAKMNPPKAAGWVVSLETGSTKLHRKDLLQVAKICKVDVKCLLTGQGITERLPNQSARDWLDINATKQPTGEQLRKVAQELLDQLNTWPVAEQAMLINYLDESIK